MIGHERFHREPIHERQIVILRILAVGEQSPDESAPDLFAGRALRGGGEEHPDERRGIALGELVQVGISFQLFFRRLLEQPLQTRLAFEGKLDPPRPDPFVRGLQAFNSGSGVESARNLQRPEGTDPGGGIGRTAGELAQGIGRSGGQPALRRPFLQDPPRVPAHELVLRRHQLDQFFRGQPGQIDARRLLLVVNDLVDAPVALVVAIVPGVVALVLVVPIDDQNRAILIVELVERLRP